VRLTRSAKIKPNSSGQRRSFVGSFLGGIFLPQETRQWKGIVSLSGNIEANQISLDQQQGETLLQIRDSRLVQGNHRA